MTYNVSANLNKGSFSVCPTCFNVAFSYGPMDMTCCGEKLIPLVSQEASGEHTMSFSRSEGDLYVTLDHPMTKEHHISFLALVKPERLELVKLYPESLAEARFGYRGSGTLYAYCPVHGLFHQTVTRVKPEGQ